MRRITEDEKRRRREAYLVKKVAGLCTSYGCQRPQSETSLKCVEHRNACNFNQSWSRRRAA